MKRLKNSMMGCLLAVVLLNYFWDEFPGLFAMYVLLFIYSIRLGMGCLREKDDVSGWVGRNACAAVRKKWTQIIGVLFLVNAAIWPLGMLVAQLVEFDTDFLLLAQIVGLPLITILGIILPAHCGKTT